MFDDFVIPFLLFQLQHGTWLSQRILTMSLPHLTAPQVSERDLESIDLDLVVNFLFFFQGSTSSLSSNSSLNSTSSSIYYSDQASPALNDFQPFDLEGWWSHRLYKNITKSLWKVWGASKATVILRKFRPLLCCGRQDNKFAFVFRYFMFS
jgi:FAM195 family